MNSKEKQILSGLLETLDKIITGQKCPPIHSMSDIDNEELNQFVGKFNCFLMQYNELADFIFSIARGELNYPPPKNKLLATQSFKSLQASLRHLTWITQQVAGGEFHHKVDFLGDFANSFNKMIIDLKNSFEKIESQKSELEAAKVQLEKLLKMKDDFLSVASHDLRTPFNAILGYSELLLSDGHLGNDDKEIIKIIQYSAETQLEYINDLLDVLKLETGEMKLHLQFTNIKDVILICIKSLGILAKNKNISIDVINLNSEDIFLYIDIAKITQVLNNLLANAIKFTHSYGKIRITYGYSSENENLEIHIIDSGIGLPEEKTHLLFNRYHQIKTFGTNGERGTGLGLSICSSIVKSHGGDISAKNNEDNGSDFFFTLPIMKS